MRLYYKVVDKFNSYTGIGLYNRVNLVPIRFRVWGLGYRVGFVKRTYMGLGASAAAHK